MVLEAEVNRRERAGPILVVPDGWYLKTSQHLHPSLALDTRCLCAGEPWMLSSASGRCLVIVWVPDPLFLLNKTPV